MRFLFLITHYYPHVYGAELFAQKIAEHLVKSGHKVDIVTGKWQEDWRPLEIINGVNVHRVKVLKVRYLQTILFIIPQYFKALELLKTHTYDYLHAHIFPSLITAILLKSSAKKVVTIQGGDLADYPEIYGFLAPVFKPLIAKALKNYQLIHAVSTDLATQIKKLTNKKSIVIPNGIDLTNISSIKKLPINAQYTLFSPSRLTEKNNLAETIQAISILNQQNHLITLKIAGTGHLKNKLESLIKKLKLEKQVKLLGHLTHDQVIKQIQLSNAVIRVSTMEGFGIAQLEAMALKTPLISSTKGGLKDFVNHQTAYIPKSLNAIEIADTIKLCIKDKTKSQTENAFKLVKKHFTWDIILPKVCQKIYRIS